MYNPHPYPQPNAERISQYVARLMAERGIEHINNWRNLIIFNMMLPVRLKPAYQKCSRRCQCRGHQEFRLLLNSNAPRIALIPYYEINRSFFRDIYILFIRQMYRRWIIPMIRTMQVYLISLSQRMKPSYFLSIQYLLTGKVESPYQLLYGMRHGPINKASDLPAWPQDAQMKLSMLTAVDEYRRTPMHYAVMYGEESLILSLAAEGADIFACDAEGVSPVEMLFKARRCRLTLSIFDQAREDRTLFSLTLTQFLIMFNELTTPGKALPALPGSLPGDVLIERFNNEEFKLFSEWLYDFISGKTGIETIDQHVMERLRQCWVASLQVVRQPITQSMLLQCVTYYKAQETYFNRIKFYLKPPMFLELLMKHEKTVHSNNRLSLLEQEQLFQAMVGYCKKISNKEMNIVTEPEKIVHRIFLALLPIFKRLGYETDDLLPAEFLDRIGPYYKGMDEIPVNRLHFLHKKPCDLDDILKQLESSFLFQDPVTLEALPESKIKEIMKHPRAQQYVMKLHEKECHNKNVISKVVLQEIKLLGQKLAANEGLTFNENKATFDLNDFLEKMQIYTPEIAMLNKVRVYVPIRNGKINYADLFDRMQHNGCTHYLGPSIAQYVCAVEALTDIKFGESRLSKYFVYIQNSAQKTDVIIPPGEDLDGNALAKNAKKLMMQ